MMTFKYELKPLNGGQFYGYIVRYENNNIYSEGVFDFEKEGWILMDQARAEELAAKIVIDATDAYNNSQQN